METRQTPPMHCCIFDYDGTLIDSPQITMITLQDIARRSGMRVPSLKELRDLWHLPWEEILWNAWATENNTVSVLFDEEHPKLRFKPYPGARRLLTSLAQKNVLLALVTNRDEESLCYTAETTGINLEHFDVLDAVDGRRYHKPDPRVFNRTWAALENTGIRRENTYVVGDGIGDLGASRGFGFPFIAFPTYVTKATTFRALGVPNSHILTDLRQLRRFV